MSDEVRASGIPPSLGADAEYLESLYNDWKKDPDSVDPAWGSFFKGFELGRAGAPCEEAVRGEAQSRVASLIYAYRNEGHLIAELDPLGNNLESHPDLDLEQFGFTEEDLDREFDTGHLYAPQRATLRDILGILCETYCRTIGAEYLHIQETNIRRWLQAQMEPHRNRPNYGRERKLEILEELINAELFEQFTHTRYPGQKRFSLEGAETLITALHGFINLAPEFGIDEVVLGMAHRGRLNVLANVLHKSYPMLFTEFEDNFLPETVGGDGDVKYHKGYSSDFHTKSGKRLHLSLTSNPSHLEAVDPVVLGRTRAKQRQRQDTVERMRVIPLLIHGDAAFAGQGLVAEALNMSRLKGYRTGGCVHFIVNNQIGFTTSPQEARSSFYCTDVAKMIEAPIFHVNGDDPEAVAYVSELALRFRQEFRRDVVVDIVCYRRHGHNESDEPAFTQPLMYKKIKDRPSVRKLYMRQLIDEGVLAEDEEEKLANEFQERLQKAFEYVKEEKPDVEVQAFEDLWKGLQEPYSDEPVVTGVDHDLLLEVARAQTTVPEGFNLNPKVARQLPPKFEAVENRKSIDWSLAEALAFGTLLCEGTPVRLTGQDSGRGTFSQRHAIWQDMDTQEMYIPLLNIRSDQARFCVYNSPLNEAACLGFEYGYSLSEPRMLILWEAQFGDFSNGAQVIIDQFLVSSQSKWQRTSGLVMLLPHGYEGQGPEHSNAYLERYLMGCAENNIQVCNLTTPAQYFHVLRRQVKRPFRRPLIIMSPKSLLRHPRCQSPVQDFLKGHFLEVLDDPIPPKSPRRLVLCSGKLYYDLLEKREQGEVDDIAILRMEQFYPFPEELLHQIAEPYLGAREIVWAQEEPQNRGGWTFMYPRLQALFPKHRILYIGREASASPAVGSLRIHKMEQEEIVEQVIRGEAPTRPGSVVPSRQPAVLTLVGNGVADVTHRTGGK